MYRLRNGIAATLRALPIKRGKLKAGEMVAAMFGGLRGDDKSCMVEIQMKAGHRMRLDVRSETEAWPYWTGSYDDDLIGKVCSAMCKGTTVLDVGANVGFWSVPLAKALKSTGGRLVSFEPIKSNFDRLCANIALNGLNDTFQGHNCALGDSEGEIEMSMTMGDHASTGNAIIVTAETGKEYHANTRARITQLDSLANEIQLNACDFIKVDIEGAEIMFLRGGKDFLARHRPVIYGEFSAVHMGQFGNSLTEVASLLPDYLAYHQVDDKFVICDLSKDSVEDILLIPKEKAADPAIQALL